MREDEVDSAFALLTEAFDAVIRTLNEDVAGAVRGSDHERAVRQLDRAIRVKELQSKVRHLSDEWRALARGTGTTAATPSSRWSSAGKRRRRLEPGLRTPRTEYREPILAVLAKMGGSGRVGDVLAEVHEIMKPRLTKHDHKPLPSNPKTPRWYNTAQWCRNDLANEGLIRRDTSRGVWQLTEEGWSEAKKIQMRAES